MENSELFNSAKNAIENLQKERESILQEDKSMEEKASDIQNKLHKVSEEKNNIDHAKEELEEESKIIKEQYDELNATQEMILKMNREIEEETSSLNTKFKALDEDKFEILVNTNEFVAEEGSELLKVCLYLYWVQISKLNELKYHFSGYCFLSVLLYVTVIVRINECKSGKGRIDCDKTKP